MKSIVFIFAILSVAFLLAYFGCSSSNDDDDDTVQPAIDDDDDDDSTADDDDSVDDDDDIADDDDDSGPPHPYTPCCDVSAESVSLTDPGLPATGPGTFQALQMERTFTDEERDREIPAYVYFPSSDGMTVEDSKAPYPLVVLPHGFSGNRNHMREYAERLATWGYITIAPSLPYSGALSVFKINHRESALDILFILNTACCEQDQSESIFYGRVDRSRLGAAGHSLGGKLSALAAWLDGGLGAVMGLDPVDGSGPIPPDDERFPRMTPERIAEVTIPTLYLGSELGGTEVLGQACAPTEENYHQYWLNSPAPSTEVTFVGGDHTDFVPQIPLDPCNIGTADPAVVKSLSAEYMVAFFNHNLLGWNRFEADYRGDGLPADSNNGFITYQVK